MFLCGLFVIGAVQNVYGHMNLYLNQHEVMRLLGEYLSKQAFCTEEFFLCWLRSGWRYELGLGGNQALVYRHSIEATSCKLWLRLKHLARPHASNHRKNSARFKGELRRNFSHLHHIVTQHDTHKTIIRRQ